MGSCAESGCPGISKEKMMPPYRPPASGNLPQKGKQILRKVYIKNRKAGHNKGYSARIAWTAVHKAGYRKIGGKWRKR
jgi:hypothetical protein